MPVAEGAFGQTDTAAQQAAAGSVYQVFDPLIGGFVPLSESPSTGPIVMTLSDAAGNAIWLPVNPPETPSSIAMNMIGGKSSQLGTFNRPLGTTPITVRWTTFFPGIGQVGGSFAPFASLWVPPTTLRLQLEAWVRLGLPINVSAPGTDCPPQCWLRQVDWTPGYGMGDLPVALVLEEYRALVAQTLQQTTGPTTAAVPGTGVTSAVATGNAENTTPPPAASGPSLTAVGATTTPTQPMPPPSVSSAVATGNGSGGAFFPSPTPGTEVTGVTTVYIVHSASETLQSISQLFYGSPNYWNSIWANNPGIGADPEALYAGEQLLINATPNLPPTSSDPGQTNQASGGRATGASS